MVIDKKDNIKISPLELKDNIIDLYHISLTNGEMYTLILTKEYGDKIGCIYNEKLNLNPELVLNYNYFDNSVELLKGVGISDGLINTFESVKNINHLGKDFLTVVQEIDKTQQELEVF